VATSASSAHDDADRCRKAAMSRLLAQILLLATATAPLLTSPALAARGFRHGVAAGDVTSTSAVLWAHANRSGGYELQVARKRRFGSLVKERGVKARRSNDNTLQARIGHLRPGTRYWFRFRGARGRARSAVGTFVTAPRPRRKATVEFAWTGDTDLGAAPGQTGPHWNRGGVFRRMRAERNDFNIHLGDTMYSDSEIPGRLRPIALTVPAKWAKYRTNLRNTPLRRLRGSAGFYSHWDDHEFVNDFSPAENSFSSFGVETNIDGRLLYRRGARAFRDYAPVTYSRRYGLYRTIRWGRNLELFFLDQRSFRSAKADEGGVCDNPQTGEPDVAPTAPQSIRNVFALVAPSLAEPVPEACREAIRSSGRTYLGQRQLRRFLREVKRSGARFKVIINELAIQQYYVLPYDRWEGYEAERQRVLSELQGVKNVVFLTADVHATLVNDARFQTLEVGGPRDSGILDVTVGSAATQNFGSEIDRALDEPGVGTLVDTAFFEPQPPAGVGMRCSIVDRYSYGQVRVTTNRLTITPKGIGGRPQRDGTRPCGPFVLRYER
jgi:phosphodiesterase/alkaline phosphatase D-like protein